MLKDTKLFAIFDWLPKLGIIEEIPTCYIHHQDLIRPGRFHEYHEVGLPDTADRHQLLHHHLSNYHLAADITFDTLVHLTHSLTVAEVGPSVTLLFYLYTTWLDVTL